MSFLSIMIRNSILRPRAIVLLGYASSDHSYGINRNPRFRSLLQLLSLTTYQFHEENQNSPTVSLCDITVSPNTLGGEILQT